MLQVLVDADNVSANRVQMLLDAIGAVDDACPRLVVAGRPHALAELVWPAYAEVVAAEGWQRADTVLAAAYVPQPGPLVLASGDGDFVHLVERHPGPVLVVSEAAAGAFRAVATVVDPVHDGAESIAGWLRATE